MNLELGPNPRPLRDGFASWDRSAEDALNLWNQYLYDDVRLSAVLGSNASNAKGDNINTVSFASTVFGQAFGADTIAVTTYYTTSSKTISEADVVFNSARSWDSYRGPLIRSANFKVAIFDFHRVAIHEFGHVLGLDHPDQAGQSVNAVMNSTISDTDVMQQDDIDGIKAIYNVPSVGRLIKTYEINAGRLLLDPIRPRVYATLPTENSLAVIDTGTLEVIAKLPVGFSPTGLSISPDNTRLYTVNSGSTSTAVTVLDLNTLQVLPPLPAPELLRDVAAGLDGRLYVSATNSSPTRIYQLDSATGVLQSTVDPGLKSNNGFLNVSPDRKTLFSASYNSDYLGFKSFDVSTPVASQRQAVTMSATGNEIPVSHNGQFLIANSDSSGAVLVSTSDLSKVYGNFFTRSASTPGPFFAHSATFSSDDTLSYVAATDFTDIKIYICNNKTLSTINSFRLPPQEDLGPYSYPLQVTSLAASGGPAGHLFVAARTYSPEKPIAKLRVFRTTPKASFFRGEVALSNGVYYLAFPDNGNVFGYYSNAFFPFLYHFDLGFEYFVDAQDGQGGAFLYDFASGSWFYTSPGFPFPYLYDFTLSAFLYYYPDMNNPGFYTKNPRYFYNFTTNQVITK